MPVAWEQIEPLLMEVDKPARYVGGEFNQVVKAEARVRGCLAFPDLYEIGMSYHGFRLLYEILNARQDWAAERAYAVWPDMEAKMRERGIPLFSLETRRALREFDWVGFTLQHEVNYTNILNMIDLGGMALESVARPDPFPLLIGGGEGAFSPEPLSPFLDAFLVGDGEEIVVELHELIARAKDEGWDKTTLLSELARLRGVYIPAFYDVDYYEDGSRKGQVAALRKSAGAPDHAPAPGKIHKRYYDVARDLGSVRPVVPLLRTVHDRLSIEIRRGCVNGCRFCQAGMITRPVNERPLGQIVEIARRAIASSGYDEVSLLSLSSADYTLIGPLVRAMSDEFGRRGVSVSLPSLRINGFDVSLVDDIARVRKTGFTFAPEAGTERLRNVINKPVNEDVFRATIEDVFKRGWRTVKFYFMLGLPTETDEDLAGIARICAYAAQIGRRYAGRKASITVTLSPFVPKSNTPFQWEAQPPREELERRYQFTRHLIRTQAGPSVTIRTADTGAAMVEAVLARGDRRVAAAIKRAHELGAHFDGWDELFRVERWIQAFAETGIDPAFYANRERGEDEILPFELIQADLGRRFLWADLRRARRARFVEKCDTGQCAGCDVCDDKTIVHTLAYEMAEGTQHKACHKTSDDAPNKDTPQDPVEAKIEASRLGALPLRAPDERPPEAEWRNEVRTAPVQRLRLVLTKLGALRFLSHLDFAKVLGIVLRRAETPLAYSLGFNAQPRIQYAPPLSLGMGGEAEWVDVFLHRRVEPEALRAALARVELAGLAFRAVEEIPLRDDSLEAQIGASLYRVERTWAVSDQARGADAAWTRESLEAIIGAWRAAPSFMAETIKGSGVRRVDLKEAILAMDVASGAPHPDHAGNAGGAALLLTISHEAGRFIKPHDAASALFGRPLALGRQVRVNRVRLVPKAELAELQPSVA